MSDDLGLATAEQGISESDLMPWERAEALARVRAIKAESQWWREQMAELVRRAYPDKRSEAIDCYNQLTAEPYDLPQRAETLRGRLISRGLIDARQAYEVRLTLPVTDAQREAWLADERERAKLQAMIDETLKHVPLERRSEAQAIYNAARGQRSEDKIRRWADELSRQGLLRSPVAKVLDALANKMMRPGETK